jgi:hypothetical protein
MLRTLVKKCYASFFASGSSPKILDIVVLEHDDGRFEYSHFVSIVYVVFRETGFLER